MNARDEQNEAVAAGNAAAGSTARGDLHLELEALALAFGREHDCGDTDAYPPSACMLLASGGGGDRRYRYSDKEKHTSPSVIGSPRRLEA